MSVSAILVGLAVVSGTSDGVVADPQTAPIQLSVGDLDASRLKPYVSHWRVVEVGFDGNTREAQRSFDQLAKAQVDGRPAWRQYQYEIPAGGSFDALSDRRTFAPFSALERAGDGGYRKLDYGPTTVRLECRGSRCPPDRRDGKVHRTDIATRVATFDYWGGTYGLLLALVPLKVGSSYVLPVLHPAQGLVRLRVDVEALETTRAANGAPIRAYRLRTPLTGWVYHVTDKPPYWVRLEYSRPDGTRQITERLDAQLDSSGSAG